MGRIVLVLSVLLLVAAAACDGDADPVATPDAPSPIATQTPEATPTSDASPSATTRVYVLPTRTPIPTRTPMPPPVGHPAGTTTGIEAVDTLVAALLEDGCVPAEMWRFREVPCVAEPINDYGPPPVCPEGVAEGTLIEIISTVGCHGGYATSDESGEPGGSFNPGRHQTVLYGVATPSNPLDERADYVVVLSFNVEAGNWGMAYEVGEGGVVAVNGGCGWPPGVMWERVEPGDVLVRPPGD